MKKAAFLALSLAFAGCGGDEPAASPVPATPPPPSTAMPALGADSGNVPPLPGMEPAGAPATGAGTAAYSKPSPQNPLLDLNNRPAREGGGVWSDQEMLDQAVSLYYDADARGLTVVDPKLPPGGFATEEEEDRWRAQFEVEIKPLASLDDLVAAGVISAIPPAPAGKKWALQNHKAVLVDP